MEQDESSSLMRQRGTEDLARMDERPGEAAHRDLKRADDAVLDVEE
jgi:hypothetical protein